MLTAISCPSCKVSLKAPGNLLGKTIHCPKCKNPVKLLVRNGPVDNAPPPVPRVTEPQSEDFPTGQDLIDDLDQIDSPPDTPAESEKAVESAKADSVEDAMEEMVEEEAVEEEAAVNEEAVEKETIEEKAAEEEVMEEVVEEEAVEEDAAPDEAITDKPAEDAAEDELAAVDEEDKEEGQLSKAVEKFLSAKLFLIKGQSGFFSMNAAWDFLHPETKKKVGTAVERPEGMLQVLRFFMRRNWLPSKIEIREEKTNELVFIVKRPAYFFNCTLEIHDPDNKLLAKFTYKPLSRMVGKPMEIHRKGGEKFATCEFYFLKGRVDLVDDKKKELANMQTESAYTKSIKIYWAARGGSYYVTFNKPLLDKPHDKMIFLGVTLAMDLLQEDSKASAGKGGISIGT